MTATNKNVSTFAVTDPFLNDIMDKLVDLNSNNPPDTRRHYCLFFRAGEIGWCEKVGHG